MTSHITQDIRLLYEAVYDEELREKATEYNQSVIEEEYINSVVENATEYFYEMGLNEYGIHILAEELGEDEFMDYVYDVSDGYSLMEARRSGKIEPVTAKGTPFKSGKPTGKSLERLRKLKSERKEREEKQSEEKPSGMKMALRSQALKSAEAKQPKSAKTEKQTKGGIGEFIRKGMGRHNTAMKLAGETAKTAKKAFATGVEALNRASDSRMAGQLRVAAKQGARRHETALKAAGGALGRTLGASQARRKATQSEEVEIFDYILEHLISEGYADTNENALKIMANMSEEWKEEILDEGFRRMNRRKIEKQAQRLGGDRGDVLRNLAARMDTEGERKFSTRQARMNRAGGAGSWRSKMKELQARDDAKSDIEKYGFH